MIMKEYFFDDGDLHDEDDDRKKKFKWKLAGEEDMDDFANMLSDSDEDDTQSNASDDEESQIKMIRLKKESSSIEQTIATVDSVAEGVAMASTCTSQSISVVKSKAQTIRSTAKISTRSTKISSFFIKDERLKGILNKRPANFAENNFNKKQKTNESKSIFDVINC